MEHTDRTLESPRHAGPWWPIGVIIALALGVLAVVAIQLASTLEDTDYPVDSPEAALQGYFNAWQAGDTTTAYDTLSIRAQASLPRREFHAGHGWSGVEPVRVWIDDRVDHDERVVLHLTVEHTWDGLFGPERERHQQRVSMVREDDAWKIDTPMFGYYPW